ncbi:MAG: F0F1 ATP synthase subunit A [Anaerolineae bacterium]|nr:F0F1 ATP synthase subunit A [Anaerolineae bacterium]
MKGVLILLGIIAVSVVFCGVIPFMVMPGAGVAVALPVIMVPGEVVWEDFLGISGLTITNTIIGTLVADVLVLWFALAATRHMKLVPGRLQGLFEVVTDGLWSLAKSTAGRNARPIFPLMATIFIFLLIANWVKLVPGAESIGLMHCAAEGVNGYDKNGILLKVDKAMDTGIRATQENYDACHHKGEHTDPAHDAAQSAVLAAAASELGVESISLHDDVGNTHSVAEYVIEQGGDVETVIAAATQALEAALPAEAEAAEGETAEARTPAELVAEVAHEPYYRDDLYAVTPFVRGAATDLNLTLGLGLLAFVAIQYFGVRAQGPRYFTKFFNTPALENVAKRPMGAMDFVVGLLEIISELAKVLSFGFRLFGNLFAGGVLLFVMSFLLAMLVPAAVYGLELFVGLIQAFVFAMLLLVFSAMAMQGHDHGGEHH